MKTKQELIEERQIIIDRNDELSTAIDTEKRDMNEAEQVEFIENNNKIEQIDLLIKAAEHREAASNGKPVAKPFIKAKPAPSFRLMNAINNIVETRSAEEHERELYSLARQEFRKAGVSSAGSIQIPSEIPAEANIRADILAQTATAGQEIVQEDKRQILGPLVDRLVFAKAGVTYLPNLVGNVSIPSYAGTSVGWKGEVEGADDGGGAFDEVTMAPKRLTAYVNVSKLFLAQDGIGAERLLMDNIRDAVARKLEETILGVATVSADAPSGIGYKLNLANDGGEAVIEGIEFADLVALETAVDTANALDGNLAYITNGAGRGLLKTAQKFPEAATGETLYQNGEVNGYRCLVTNAVPDNAGTGGDGNAIYFANWKDLVIGQWAGYDITVDPYSRAQFNQVRLVINAFFDAKGLRGKTGTSTTLDEYAVSFAAASFKAE